MMMILTVAFLVTSVFRSQSQLSKIQETKKSQMTYEYDETAAAATIAISPQVPKINSNEKDYSTLPPPKIMVLDAMPKLQVVSKPTSTDLFKPRMSLHHLGDCMVDPSQNMTRLDLDSFEYYSNSSHFYYVNVGNDSVPDSTTTTTTFQKNNGTRRQQQQQQHAICEFQDRKYATHFAHAMQQLYGCWSYWQDNLPTLTPVLLIPPKVWRKLKKNAFVSGFLESLQATIHLQIMGRRQFLEMTTTRKTNNSSSLLYNADHSLPAVIVQVHVKGGYILDHAQRLRNMIGKHYSLPSAQTTVTNCTSTTNPRVAILNRHKNVGRSIINVDSLQTQLQERLGLDYQPPVVYFDGLSFQKQIEFFASVDILISPHGAQLVGLPFMTDIDIGGGGGGGGGCKHNKKSLLELFPKEYGIPDLYGSLAAHAGISYAYLYLSSGTLQEEMSPPNSGGLLHRIHARSTNMCPSPQTIVDSVQVFWDDWKAAACSCSKLLVVVVVARNK
jgi:hypothetical protein